MKILSYKYKFKQIFKKIGQAKSFGSFLCIPANVSFVAVLTWTAKVKNKHISVELSNCRTIGLSDYRIVGLTDCRIIAPQKSDRHVIEN